MNAFVFNGVDCLDFEQFDQLDSVTFKKTGACIVVKPGQFTLASGGQRKPQDPEHSITHKVSGGFEVTVGVSKKRKTDGISAKLPDKVLRFVS